LTFDRASWIARHLLPHEADVRRWIASRTRVGRTYDVDDIVQEAYARIGTMDPATISHPKAYFFRTARNLILEHLQRERIVPIEGMADFDLKNIRDTAPGPEHIVSARQDLKRFQEALATLPPQCREVFLLGKVAGLSQKDIAIRMGLAESTVEKHLSRALRLLLQRYESTPESVEQPTVSGREARK
jgi:RNA polymerase sigma factor (sigma-70 family)